MSVFVPVCDSTTSQNGAIVECAGNWVLTEVPDFAEFTLLAGEGTTFTLDDLDASSLMSAYAAGFTLIAMAWAVSIGVKTVLSMLR